MVRTLVAALSSIVVSLATLGAVVAQTGPIVNPPVNPNPPAVESPNDVELVKALRELDPNLKIEKREDGGFNYRLKIQKDGWSYELLIESMKDGIWINAVIGTVGDVKKIPAEMLAGLLEANFKIGPCHFTLVKLNNGSHALELCYHSTRNLSAEQFRMVIDHVCKNVRETYPIWSPILAAK